MGKKQAGSRLKKDSCHGPSPISRSVSGDRRAEKVQRTNREERPVVGGFGGGGKNRKLLLGKEATENTTFSEQRRTTEIGSRASGKVTDILVESLRGSKENKLA